MSVNDAIVNIPPSHLTESYNEKDKHLYTVSAVEVPPEESLSLEVTRYSGMRNKSTVGEKPNKQMGWDGEEDAIKSLGKLYSRILGFSVITRYALCILPVALLLAIPLAIFATVAKNAHAKGTRLLGLFVWLEIVWVGLWVAKLCAKTLPYIFQFLCGMVSAGTRKSAELIRALEIPLSIVVWTILAWATVPVMDRFNMVNVPPSTVAWSNGPWTATLRRALLASIPVSIVFFLEKLSIQMIAVDYHQKQFTFKINESKRMLEILTELYSASVERFPAYTAPFEDEDLLIHNTLLASSVTMNLGRSSAGNPFRIVGGIARVGNGMTSIFNHIAAEVIGGRKLDPSSNKAIVIAALEKRTSAEALGRRLWISTAESGNDALYERDIVKVLGPDRQAEAEDMFQRLDRDRNGDVSIEEMQWMMADLERGQKAMVKSLLDVKQSVAALDRILKVAALVLSGVVYAAFFSADFVSKLTILTTSIMSFSFAFAGTVQEFAGSCIFIFSKHPYDIDDRVDINGVEMTVKHISLLFTVFERVDTHRLVQIPNIVSNSAWIENVTRSGAMKEQIHISIDAGTSAEDIETLQTELREFVAAPENKRDYASHVTVDVFALGDCKSLDLAIDFGHKSNWTNETLRASRRARFITHLLATLRRIPIYCPGGGDAALGDAARPAYSVSVTDADAQAARARFAADKEAKRSVGCVEKESGDALATGVDANFGFPPRRDPRRPSGLSARDLRHMSVDELADERRRSSIEARGARPSVVRMERRSLERGGF